MKRWRYILLGVVLGAGGLTAAQFIAPQSYYACVLTRLDAMRSEAAVDELVRVCRQRHGYPQ